MHQTRQQTPKLIPVPRKGTKYIARPLSHLHISIPAVIAIRDMLNLAKTTKEVKEMIKQKLIKINGNPITDYRASIKLFNIFEAGNNSYKLTILPTGKFHLEEIKNNKLRLCKVINKKILSNNAIQLNLHDGSNINSDIKVKINDSVYLDSNGKIAKHIPIEAGRSVLIFSGKHLGSSGIIESAEESKSIIKLSDKSAEIENRRFIVL